MERTQAKSLVVAWLSSALAFSIAVIAWGFLTVRMQAWPLPPAIGVLRLGALALGAGLIVQLVYGALVYLVLTRLDLWRMWTVALAYLLPAALLGWAVGDATRNIPGAIACLLVATIVALVSWFSVPAR